MKKTFVLIFSIFCVLLLASTVSATHKFSTAAEADEYQIASNHVVIYDLAITNNQDKSERLIIEPGTTGWDINIKPYLMDIGPGETKHTTIRISPPKGVSLGSYTIEIILRSLDDPSTRTRKYLPVVIDRIVREKGDELLEINHNFPEKISFGEERIVFDVAIKSIIRYPMSRLTFVAESELLTVPYRLYIPRLDAGDEKIFQDISVKLAEVSTGPYVVKIQILEGDQILYEKDHATYFGSYGLVEQKYCYGSLIKKCVVTLRNEKVVNDTDTFNLEIGGWGRHVTRFDPLPDQISSENKIKTASWQYSLSPGEEQEYKYTTWYLFYIIAIIIIAIGVLFGFYEHSLDFQINKKVIATPGSRSMKIKLSVKNKRASSRHNVIVEDVIPSPLVLVKEFGTVEPTVIKQEAGKVKVIWKFPELGPGEERIMSYRMRSTVGIVGKMALPFATVRIHIKNKLKKFYSNEASIIGKQDINNE